MRRRATLDDKPRHTAPAAPAVARPQARRKWGPALVGRVAALVAQGILVGLIAVAIVTVVAPQVSAYITPQSYVYGDTLTAVLIQWTEHDGQMNGAIQIASVDAPDQIIRAQYSGFIGTHDGWRVSITFSDLQTSAQTVEGTLGWRSLRLDLPQSGGQITSVRLLPGDPTGYTRAVQAIQQAHPGLEIQGD